MNILIKQLVKDYYLLDATDIKVLPSGINYVYLITTADEKFVLKRYIKRTGTELAAIHAELVKLMQNGFPIPPIVQNKDGNYLTITAKGTFDLCEFIEHIDLSDQVTISDQHLQLAAKTLSDVWKRLQQSTIAKLLKPVNFEQKVTDTLTAITEFKTNFDKIRSQADEKQQIKLDNLKELVYQTDKYRAQGKQEFTAFLGEENMPTQGDFSMVNILIDKSDQVYVIDWDGLNLRPLVWDLQAALSLFGLKELGNAYIMEPDLHKVKLFLSSFLINNSLSRTQLDLLPEVVKFNFAIYWLSYTLPAVNSYDFRLLFLIPDEVEKGLYWVNNLDKYREFIASIN